ncbi:uncharacterized protein LOC141857076 [Brevipalpus obovatus]|uniref:uncharacterized protein LOC141857076 n=1 Tax=Brevipalpus obovatus TaxID=246614 RepID=UPI003D9DE06A
MNILLFTILAGLVLNVSNGDLVSDTAKNIRKGLPKLMKVLGWLVLEKDDDISSLMTAERRKVFVDYVLERHDLCQLKGENEVTCKALRQDIDSNKENAGTVGIDLDARMTSFGQILARTFNTRNADVVKPYGVYTLLEFALEFGNSKHTRTTMDFPAPDDIAALIRFIVVNKGTIWAKINEGIKEGEKSILKKPDVTPLENYLMENVDNMGFNSAKPTHLQMRSALEILSKSYDLFAHKPTGIFRY